MGGSTVFMVQCSTRIFLLYENYPLYGIIHAKVAHREKV